LFAPDARAIAILFAIGIGNPLRDRATQEEWSRENDRDWKVANPERFTEAYPPGLERRNLGEAYPVACGDRVTVISAFFPHEGKVVDSTKVK